MAGFYEDYLNRNRNKTEKIIEKIKQKAEEIKQENGTAAAGSVSGDRNTSSVYAPSPSRGALPVLSIPSAVKSGAKPYEASVDYQAEINKALSEGNYSKLKSLEKTRNLKISGEKIKEYKKTEYYQKKLKPDGIAFLDNTVEKYGGITTEDYRKAAEKGKSAWAENPVAAVRENLLAAAGSTAGNIASFANMLGADKVPVLKNITNSLIREGQKQQQTAQSYNNDTAGKYLGGFTQGLFNLASYISLPGGGAGQTAAKTAAKTSGAARGISKAAQVAQTVVKQPSFWYSVANMGGQKYQQDIDEGYSRARATANAFLYALPSALVEVSGGVGSSKFGKETFTNSFLQEVGEEVVQQLIENTSDKIVVKPEKKIFDFRELAETAASAAPLAAVGGAFGRLSSYAGTNTSVRGLSQADSKTGVKAADTAAGTKTAFHKDVNTRRNAAAGEFTQKIQEFFTQRGSSLDFGDKARKIANDIIYRRDANESDTKYLFDAFYRETTEGLTKSEKIKGKTRKQLKELKGQFDEMLSGMVKQISDIPPASVSVDYDFAVGHEKLAAIDGKRVGPWDGRTKTLEMALDDVFKGDKNGLAAAQYDLLIPRNEAQTVRGDILDWAYDLAGNAVKNTGIKLESRESAAAQMLAEGRRPVAQPDGSVKYVEYGIADVKKSFPKKVREIETLAREIRGAFDTLYSQLDVMLDNTYGTSLKRINEQLEMIRGNIDALNSRAERMHEFTPQDAFERSKMQELCDHLTMRRSEIKSELKQKKLAYRQNYIHHRTKKNGFLKQAAEILKNDITINPDIVGKTDETRPYKKWTGFMEQQGSGIYDPDILSSFVEYASQAADLLAYTPYVHRVRAWNDELRLATSATGNANGLISFLDSYANDIVGKTNRIDNAVKSENGRKIMQLANLIQGRVASNKILGNFSSGISQIFNIPNAARFVQSPKAWAEGVVRSFASLNPGSESGRAYADSTFVRDRFSDDKAYRIDPNITKYPKKFAQEVIQIGDRMGTALIWQTAYSKGKSDGLSGEALTRYADDITRRSVAGRGVGEVPVAFNSIIIKNLAPFQIEVNNSWKLYKSAVRDADFKAFFTMAAVSYAMNSVTKELFGKEVGMNLIQAVIDGVAEGKDEENILKKIGKFAGRIGGEIGSNIAGGSLIATALVPDETQRKTLFGDSDPSRFGAGHLGLQSLVQPALNAKKNFESGNTALGIENLTDYVYDFAVPYGGTQLKRFVKGAQDFGLLPRAVSAEFDSKGAVIREGGFRRNEFPASYDSKGNLRFPIDNDPQSIAKSMLLGSFQTRAGQEYLENGSKPMTAKRTAQIEKLFEMGANAKYAIEVIDEANSLETLRDSDGNEIERSKDRKVDFLLSTRLTPQQRQYVLDSIVTNNNLDINKYAELADINREAAKKYGTYYKKLEQFNSMTDKQKLSFDEMWGRWADASAAGIDMKNYAVYKQELNEASGDGSVSIAERSNYLLNSQYKPEEKWYFFMDRSNPSKTDVAAQNSGIDIDVWLKYRVGLPDSTPTKAEKIASALNAASNAEERRLLSEILGVSLTASSSGKKTSSSSKKKSAKAEKQKTLKFTF